MAQIRCVLGLMSGTSMDGIDMALIDTDGDHHITAGACAYHAYDDAHRHILQCALEAARDMPLSFDVNDWPQPVREASQLVTDVHCQAVRSFLDTHHVQPDLIGFHGQTIIHRPDCGYSLQIGDGAQLADNVGIDVVSDFRRADMAAGGQGAPLVPLFHAAIATNEVRPVAIINLGGIANISFLGEAGEIIAFDTGPANVLIDQWVYEHTKRGYDDKGHLAARGRVNETILADLMRHDFFARPIAKSCDRGDFSIEAVRGLSLADGAATLTALSAVSLSRGMDFLPSIPHRYIICGGGRHNATLCDMIADRLDAPIVNCDRLGWHGDSLEAQAFAWLAVRSVDNKPLTLPSTTAVSQPMSGGVYYSADRRLSR